MSHFKMHGKRSVVFEIASVNLEDLLSHSHINSLIVQDAMFLKNNKKTNPTLKDHITRLYNLLWF